MRIPSPRSLLVAFALVVLSAPVSGCCFGAFADGFQQGFNTELECQPLIDAVNGASAAVGAVPEAPENGTLEQFDAEYAALGTAYDAGATRIAAVALTQPGLVAPRDEIVALYREASTGMQSVRALLPAAYASGDPTAIDAQMQSFSTFETRESAIIGRINAACNRQ